MTKPGNATEQELPGWAVPLELRLGGTSLEVPAWTEFHPLSVSLPLARCSGARQPAMHQLAFSKPGAQSDGAAIGNAGIPSLPRNKLPPWVA